jgi:hypothetical protein
MASCAVVFVEEAAEGGRGTGDNVLTLTMRNEHDRAKGPSCSVRVEQSPFLRAVSSAAVKRRPNGTRS